MIVSKEKKGPRISLLKVFCAGLAGILSIFILLSYFTFTRLLSFESTLAEVSDKSLPNLIRISQLYSQASTLLESTELLSKSSSAASKRLAEKQIQVNLISIRKAAIEAFDNDFLDIQLNTIATELDEFSALITEHLQTIESIERLRTDVNNLNTQAIDLEKQKSSLWVLNFSQALISISRALNEKKLQRVRFLFNQVKKHLDKLDSISDQGQYNNTKKQLTKQLKTLLFAKDGMEALKIKSLRLEGRAIGRDNFVHSLIEDYITQIGFVTSETEQDTINQVGSSVIEMREQTQLIRLILIGGVIFLLVIVVLFQQRILKRLNVFNHIVRSQSQGLHPKVMLKGNDEITDLAETFSEFTKTIEKQKHKLELLSMSDGLTGIGNRRALDIRLKHDIDLSFRQKSSVSILLMDIDCFKLYNDNYGHSAGDDCLKKIASFISTSLRRDSDFLARYGGEEFVCVLPNTDTKGAAEVAICINTKLNQMMLPHTHSQVTNYVTLSIGIATSQPNNLLTPEMIIKQADKALYSAKNSGKNTHKIYSTNG